MDLMGLYGDNLTKSMFFRSKLDGCQIIGKYVRVSLEPGPVLDVWLTPRGKMREGFSARKLGCLLKGWKGDEQWVVLDGEAWCKSSNLGCINDNLRLLGLKKKPCVSAQTQAMRLAALARARKPPK